MKLFVLDFSLNWNSFNLINKFFYVISRSWNSVIPSFDLKIAFLFL